MKRIAPVLVILLISMSSPVIGAPASVEPLDILKIHVDKVITILDDPKYQDPALQKLQNEKIWDVILNVFDFDIIAKLALGRNRHRFTSGQLDEFTDLFSKLLKNTYIDRLKGEYRGQNVKIKYLKQEFVGNSMAKAIVRTTALHNNVETPIDYSMLMQGGKWKIYDLRIEKVSLVRNYREQFDEILFKESPLQLIERLKKKVEAQDNKGISEN